MYSSTRDKDTFSGTGFFPLDRETKGASAATGIPLESDEDSNDNDNDIESENCILTIRSPRSHKERLSCWWYHWNDEVTHRIKQSLEMGVSDHWM